MLPLIVGTVTLAAVGYAVKELCEEEGCFLDEFESLNTTKSKNSDVAKKFHSYKKGLYKIAKKQYKEFIEQHNVVNVINLDEKLPKEKFSQKMITAEIESKIIDITEELSTLVSKLELSIELLKNKQEISEQEKEEVQKNMQNIYELAHRKLFDSFSYKNENLKEVLKRSQDNFNKVYVNPFVL